MSWYLHRRDVACIFKSYSNPTLRLKRVTVTTLINKTLLIISHVCDNLPADSNKNRVPFIAGQPQHLYITTRIFKPKRILKGGMQSGGFCSRLWRVCSSGQQNVVVNNCGVSQQKRPQTGQHSCVLPALGPKWYSQLDACVPIGMF